MSNVYQIKLKHVSQGQSGLNVFKYLSTQTGTSKELGEAFLERVFPPIRDTVCASTQFVELEVNCLTSTIIPDYVATLLNTFGEIGGDELPAYVATAHTLKVASSNFRNGAKRIPGVPESQQADGEVIAGYEVLLQTAALFMYGILVETATDYLPGLAKTNDLGVSYIFSQLVDAAWQRLSSQNTRKVTSGGGTIDLLIPDNKLTWEGAPNNWVGGPLTPGSLLPYDNWVAMGNNRIEGFVTVDNPPLNDLT